MSSEREEIAALLFEHADSYCAEGFGYSDTDTRQERMRGCLHLADALADLLAARDRRVMAEAWDEGYEDGADDMYGQERGYDVTPKRNPYRDEADA